MTHVVAGFYGRVQKAAKDTAAEKAEEKRVQRAALDAAAESSTAESVRPFLIRIETLVSHHELFYGNTNTSFTEGFACVW